MLLRAILQLLVDRDDKFRDARGFYHIIVHLASDSLQGSLQCWIPSQNQSYAVRLRAPHRADHGKSIARLSDVEIGNEHIELLRRDLSEGFFDCPCRSNFEPVDSKNRG